MSSKTDGNLPQWIIIGGITILALGLAVYENKSHINKVLQTNLPVARQKVIQKSIRVGDGCGINKNYFNKLLSSGVRVITQTEFYTTAGYYVGGCGGYDYIV